jgi:hypothetical protein
VVIGGTTSSFPHPFPAHRAVLLLHTVMSFALSQLIFFGACKQDVCLKYAGMMVEIVQRF